MRYKKEQIGESMEKFRIGGEFRTVSNLIKRKFDADPVLVEQKNVTGTHGYVLGFIRRKNAEGIKDYQRDIEQAFSIRRSTATEILNVMEQNELIVRKPNEQDKRMKEIVVTEKATKIHEKIIERLDTIDGEIKSVLTVDEISSLESIITKLKDYLNDEGKKKE